MRSLDDLKTRLGVGRRVLALFHPLLKNEPLLFVHVALTDEMPSSLEQVMEVLPNESPACATFYSITNAQPGLAGIGLGEYLLKQSISVSPRVVGDPDSFQFQYSFLCIACLFVVVEARVLVSTNVRDAFTDAQVPEVVGRKDSSK